MELNMEETKVNKPNNTLIFALIIVAVISVMVTMVLISKKSKSVQQPVQDMQPNPEMMTEETNGTTSLYFSPTMNDAFAGEVITVNAYMNTGENLVNGVEFKTVFDPNVFEVTKFTKEPTMDALSQEIKNDIDNTAGVFSYSAFGLDKELFLNGSDLFLFTLEVKVKESAPAGVYTFDFDPSTTISASGAGQNVFQKSTPQQITVASSY